MTQSPIDPNSRESWMPRRITLTSAVLLTALAAGCASTPSVAPRPSAATRCDATSVAHAAAPSFSEPLRVVHAAPVREIVGRHPTGAMRGADISVVAPLGYDAVDVRRLLACRAEAARSGGSSNDLLSLPDIAVRVSAHGSGFVARVTARRRALGAEVWQRASRLPTN